MTFLVDTNVVSELTKRRPNPGALAWHEAQTGLTLSAITVDELSFVVMRAPPTSRARLVAWLEALLASRPTIVAIDVRVARVAGQLRADAANHGQALSQPDALVAACALSGDHTLVTRNIRDFRGTGVRLLDPFV